MKKIVNISVLTVVFLSFGISNAGLYHWLGRFDYWVMQRMFLKQTDAQKNARFNDLNSRAAQIDKDRFGSEPADAQHNGFVMHFGLWSKKDLLKSRSIDIKMTLNLTIHIH